MSTVRPRVRAVEDRRRFGGGGVAAFGEMLTVGLVITALSLPLVTAVPALAAGVHHLDRHLSARSDTLRELLASFWQALRTGWAVGAGGAVLIGVALLHALIGRDGSLPGGAFIAVAGGGVALVIAVVLCRAAALWRPGRHWRGLLRWARHLAVSDPVGTAYAVLGLGVGVVVVWMLPPLIVIAPGMLALALVAAERRRRGALLAKGIS